MPAMLYEIKKGTLRFMISNCQIQCPEDEVRFIDKVKRECESFGVEFDESKLERYYPYWETKTRKAIFVEKFEWPENVTKSRANQMSLF